MIKIKISGKEIRCEYASLHWNLDESDKMFVKLQLLSIDFFYKTTLVEILNEKKVNGEHFVMKKQQIIVVQSQRKILTEFVNKMC